MDKKEKEVCLKCGRIVEPTEKERNEAQLEILREYAPDVAPEWDGEDGG